MVKVKHIQMLNLGESLEARQHAQSAHWGWSGREEECVGREGRKKTHTATWAWSDYCSLHSEQLVPPVWLSHRVLGTAMPQMFLSLWPKNHQSNPNQWPKNTLHLLRYSIALSDSTFTHQSKLSSVRAGKQRWTGRAASWDSHTALLCSHVWKTTSTSAA